MQISDGKPYPLGATWDGLGVNFALFSENATKVELCLFDSADSIQETHRITLPEYNAHVWHGFVRDIRPGQLYGYRVYGPYEPEKGLRFNPNKILTDPYAKSVVRSVKWDDSLFGYTIGDEDEDLSFDSRDSAAFAPLCAVIDPSFIWGEDKPPQIPWNRTIIYEAHVKGMTMLNMDIPEELRGTYSAIASAPVIELMPVHHRVNNRSFIERGLTDYWGYNTLSFFAPDTRFSSLKGPTENVQEFKMMVRALHAAGIEVILDVVYNHTVEGSHMGPTLSFRGVDNTSYYRTVDGDHRYYMDYTGCGNTLNMVHPRVIQLIMDSLRYWVQEMHVDGFRFDLASALARELYDVNNLSAFFDVIQQDPVISQVKLIAEPWDVGPGGYQVGNFPVLWTEWNGKYRDTMRQFVKGDSSQLGQMASRMTGSSDLYEHSGRKPHASINFVTCHDGFTLHDLVSYNEKHNEANGEESRDGESHNNSWNCGAEGDTDIAATNKLRYQQKRNFMALLFLSLGVPMLSGGDELGRTQKGNNNAYCQDDEISWYKWDMSEEDEKFFAFLQKIIQIRKEQLVIHRKTFFKASVGPDGTSMKDIFWLNSNGKQMSEADWLEPERKVVGVLLDGSTLQETDALGRTIDGNTVLLLANAHYEDVPFVLPKQSRGKEWKLLLDTSEAVTQEVWGMQKKFSLKSRSVVLFSLLPDLSLKPKETANAHSDSTAKKK